jgi:hypothetical protein
MNRRTFISGSLGSATIAGLPAPSRAAQSTPSASGTTAELSTLTLTLTDTGFEIDEPLTSGRFRITVSNAGTLTDSHFALGKIPDDVTDAEYEAFLDAQDDTESLSFEDIAFVGVPDWPAPGGSVSGVIDLAPGQYLLFDPFAGREPRTLMVGGDPVDAPEPASDLTVELHEMAIDLPESAFTSQPMRWKIVNTGAMSHDVAVLPVSPDFTTEQFEHVLNVMLNLSEDATPPPGLPEFDYQPVSAIGILAPQHTSWLDVQLAPSRYLAVCMLPFGTGYPHAVDGMYRVFDVE